MSNYPADFKAASRDLTTKVRQVREILPQCADDQVCMALAQVDDDVMRAVELLLTATEPDEPTPPPPAPAPPAAPAQAAPKVPVREPSPEKPQEKRPPTALERELLKWRKKLRDIEKIETNLAQGKKVEPLQLVKIERKMEVEAEVIKAELKASAEAKVLAREAAAREEVERKERIMREKEEARERAEQARQQRAERDAEARRSAEREAEAARRAQAAQAAQEARRPAPAASRGEAQNAGMELLQMVQGTSSAPANMPPMPTPPVQQGGAAKGSTKGYPPAQGEPRRHAPAQTGGTVLPPPRARAGPTGQFSAETADAGQGRRDISEYSTQLDIKNIPRSVQEKAERVAAEIEREQAQQGKGGGKGFRNGPPSDGFTVKGKGKEGKGKGKQNFAKDGGGYFGDKGKGKGERGGERGYSGDKGQQANGGDRDGGFEDWLKERRTQQVGSRQVRS